MTKEQKQANEKLQNEKVEQAAQKPQKMRLGRLRNEDGVPNYLLLGGVFVAVILVVWVVALIASEIKLANSRILKISNLWYYGRGMSETSEISIQSVLYSVVELNLPEEETPPHHGAKIRSGSYSQEKVGDSTDTNNVWHSEFIVDIAKLQQSYKVSMDWPLGEMQGFSNYYPEVTCLSSDEVIYKDFVCKELPPRFPGEKSNPSRYLPHTEVDENGVTEWTVWLNNGEMMVRLETCGNAEKYASYKAAAQAWLESTEMELEKFKITYIEVCYERH